MAETEENGEWRALISSPKSVNNLFSGFLADGFSSPTASVMSGGGGGFFGGNGIEVGMEAVKMEGSSEWKPPSGRNEGGGGRGTRGGSFSERRAARCGFNAPKINTARFRSISPLSSPSVRSPYLTIPPGLSPASLLDSPVMLPNAQALPSPTTGTFRLPNFSFESTMSISATGNFDKDKNADLDCPFMFKPHVEQVSLHCASGSDNQFSSPPFVMGFIFPMILLLMKHLGKTKKSLRFLRAAGSLTAVVLGNAFVKIFHPSTVSVVGDIPQGLPKHAHRFRRLKDERVM